MSRRHMRQSLRRALRRLNKESGQGMTEYIIIVALIAIAAIGVVTVFGQDIRLLFGASTAALAGEVNVASKARSGMRQATKQKSLKNFAQDNAGF